MKVNVHIERLVIDGGAEPLSRDDISAALRTELARLIAAQTPVPRAGSVAGVRTAPLSFANMLTAQTLGTGIAGPIYSALSLPTHGAAPPESVAQ